MTEQERFLFDLQGYITVPNALDAGQLKDLNALLDQKIAEQAKEEDTTKRFGGLLRWGQACRDLIDNPRITPYLDAIYGGGAYRLDHDYADLIRSGVSPIGATLHGGSTPFDPGQFYHWHNGKMNNGLVVVAYNLHDVNPGDGGFGCVPGTHKSNLPYPPEWRNLDQPQPCVRAVTGPAGTAIIFTEALTHGAMPWKGKHERRTFFYKYNSHALSWAAKYYEEDSFGEGQLTERQRALLEPPNSRYQGRPTSPKKKQPVAK